MSACEGCHQWAAALWLLRGLATQRLEGDVAAQNAAISACHQGLYLVGLFMGGNIIVILIIYFLLLYFPCCYACHMFMYGMYGWLPNRNSSDVILIMWMFLRLPPAPFAAPFAETL